MWHLDEVVQMAICVSRHIKKVMSVSSVEFMRLGSVVPIQPGGGSGDLVRKSQGMTVDQGKLCLQSC